MKITIDNVQTILSVLGEEDTCVGFENDVAVQDAIEVLQTRIEAKIAGEHVSPRDVLISFE